jgi:Fe-S-cluster-containing dehydrogenase component
VQRIRRAERTAAQEGRSLRDGDIQPACAQACPTDALVFGDLNDPNSRVSRLAQDPRRYRLLEELGTEPAVVYLKKVVPRQAAAKLARQVLHLLRAPVARRPAPLDVHQT